MKEIVWTLALFLVSEVAVGQGVLDDQRPDAATAATQALEKFLHRQDVANRKLAFMVRIDRFIVFEDRLTSSRRMLFRVADEATKSSRLDLIKREAIGQSRSRTFYAQQIKKGAVVKQSAGRIEEYYLPRDITTPGYRTSGPISEFDPFSATLVSSGPFISGKVESSAVALLTFQFELEEASYTKENTLIATWRGKSKDAVLVWTAEFDPRYGNMPKMALWRVIRDWDADGDDRFGRTISRTDSTWIEKDGQWFPSSIDYSGRDGGNKLSEDFKLRFIWGEVGSIEDWTTDDSIKRLSTPDIWFEELWDKWSTDSPRKTDSAD